ncbi:MAG: SURF1 family protein [Pseudonocardiaceae bacterium]|nr:SURF1 family protein [Pseudonocardiaceae bacterium]
MRWTFLLRPGWVALILVVGSFTVLAFTVLAPWQFGRDDARAARNVAIEESFRSPPVPLREVLPSGRAPDPDSEWRQVELTGRYLPRGETVVRLRSVLGEPAFEVVVPVRLTDGTTVLVDRGYLRPAPGVRVPDYPPVPRGEVTLQGRLRVAETDPGDRPAVRRDGTTQIYAIDPATVTSLTGIELQPGYVQLNAGQPGVLSALPLPQRSSGPHLAYALQWLAFGVMAPLGLGYFAWREGTDRRPDEPRGRTVDPRDRDPADPRDPPVTAAPLADRYGTR